MRSERDLLAEALRDLQKGETVERALSRILRRYGGTYADYVRIMGDVRDRATREKIPPLEAAKRLSQA